MLNYGRGGGSSNYVAIHAKGLHKSFAFIEGMKWDSATAKLILVQSTPLIAQYAISIISWEYFYILIEHHGKQALAISNTMRNIFGLFGIFAWSLAATTNTMVSNLIGQERTEEVLPLIWRIGKISVAVQFVYYLPFTAFPEMFLSIYRKVMISSRQLSRLLE